MDTTIQIETHLTEISFISTGFDSKKFIQQLRCKLEKVEFLTIKNSRDRDQFEASTLFASSSSQLNQIDVTGQTEDQLIVNMIKVSSISTNWFIARLNDENTSHIQKITRDLIKMYEGHLTFNWPEFNSSMRWFAIGVPINEVKELSLGMTNHGNQILVYWLNSFVSDDQQKKEPAVKLTPREHDVLRWASEGRTSQEIARILGISPKTVNLHADNLINKLNASNRTNAVVRAMRLGLI